MKNGNRGSARLRQGLLSGAVALLLTALGQTALAGACGDGGIPSFAPGTNVLVAYQPIQGGAPVVEAWAQVGSAAVSEQSLGLVESCDATGVGVKVSAPAYGNAMVGAGEASLSAGRLRGFAMNDGVTIASFQDQLTFHVDPAAAAHGPLTVHLLGHIDGVMSNPPGGDSVLGLLETYVGSGSGEMIGYSAAVGLAKGEAANQVFKEDGFDISLQIVDGQMTFLQSRLLISASAGSLADFMNTAQLTLLMPTGVSFTSASGVFLADHVTSAVPEPASAGLLLLGLLGLVGVQLRRKVSGSAVPA